MLDDEAAATVADPDARADQLRAALAAVPALAPLVAAHRNVDDPLLRALEDREDPAVDDALMWREPPIGGWKRPLRGLVANHAASADAGVDGADPDQTRTPEPSRRRLSRTSRGVMLGAVVVVLCAGVTLALTRSGPQGVGSKATPTVAEPVAAADVLSTLPVIDPVPTAPIAEWWLGWDDLAATVGVAPSDVVVGSLAAQGAHSVAVVTGRYAERAVATVLGIDLAGGTTEWSYRAYPDTSCTADPFDRADLALCNRIALGATAVVQLDLSTGKVRPVTGDSIGTVGGDVVTMAPHTVDRIRLSLVHDGAPRWTTTLPERFRLPGVALKDGADPAAWLHVLPLPTNLGLTAIHIAAGVPCTHFSGDGGQCGAGTTDDPGRTVLLDTASGELRGELHGIAQLPVGDGWYVRTATGLALQSTDRKVISEPHGVSDDASSVLLVSGDLLVGSQELRTTGRTVVAVDHADANRLLWSRRGEAIATDGSRVILTTVGAKPITEAVDITTGEVVWELAPGADVRVWGAHLAEVSTQQGLALLSAPNS